METNKKWSPSSKKRCDHIELICHMTNKDYHTYDFPNCKYLVVCGDIHDDFNLLVNKVCVQFQLQDTVVIVAGDCGFGFEKKSYYDNIIKRNSKRMNEANNWIVFIRGNHDNPAYFDGHTFVHKRFLAIPDYSVVKACGHTVLCIGGAISVDRSYRIRAWRQIQEKKHRYGRVTGEQDTLSPNYYWENEAPQYERELLEKIIAENNIDTVVTHTAPSFCELQSKNEGAVWVAEASKLLQDIQEECSTIDEIYNCLKAHSVTHWFYGHFHQSWLSTIEGISFKMLNIMELHEIR